MANTDQAVQPYYNVLIVDDDRASVEAYVAVLARGPCHVLSACSGDQALRMLLDQDVALVVLDIQMPGMNGFEVAHFMRARAKTRDIPVLFMTAHDHDLPTQARAYDLGGIDFLCKPINGELFLAKVSVLLKLYHSRAQLADANRRLNEERQYYAAILAAATEGILVVDRKGIVQYANPAACALLQFQAAQLIGSNFHQRLTTPDGNVVPLETALLRQMDRPGHNLRINDINLLTADGESIAVRLSGATLAPSHQGYVLVFLDNRPTKALQSQLEQLVVTDPLTGLVNRTGFISALELAVERAQRDRSSIAVMYLDLDGFKNVNDTMGHAQGDVLLRKIAERLKDGIRASDVLARIGGDEFTVLLDRLTHAEDAAHIAEKLLALIEMPLQLENKDVHVSASIGIATFPDCGDSVENLLKSADVAMYQAKHDGRRQYRFFTAEMNGRARARFMLQESLRTALDTNEFFLQYQPQIALRDGRLRGFEALLRWQHKRAGIVAPSLFIPLLEETMLINQAGSWVAAESCRALTRLRDALQHPITVSINLSPRQFTHRELANQLLSLIDQHGIDPSQIEVEVTESTLMHDINFSLQILDNFRSHGIKVALDDFGTGYSSLGYLRQFNVDVLKIDRVFLQNALTSKKDAAIVETIINLSHVLDIEVVAEGVETLAQAQWLADIGCDYAQGYLFAKPLDESLAAKVPLVFNPICGSHA